MVINSKRELAKMKYSEIKKKNIIRQDMSNNLKLPELKNINVSGKNGSHEETGLKSNRNGLSINVNLNLNLNVCIESGTKEITGRARAATLPDELWFIIILSSPTPSCEQKWGQMSVFYPSILIGSPLMNHYALTIVPTASATPMVEWTGKTCRGLWAPIIIITLHTGIIALSIIRVSWD